MRIVAGTFGGRKIHVPKGRDIRPTTDKIRGAIFNALQSRGAVEGARVIDCFCGTGALGLEAISRGAERCVFIDNSRSSLDVAKENAAALGVKEEARFILKDAARLGPRPEGIPPATLVFIDPPYGEDLIAPALDVLHGSGWLAEGAILVLESGKKDRMTIPSVYETLDERIYKDTKITTLRYNP